MSAKWGIALVTPHIIQGMLGLTEYVNTPEFLSVVLPPLSFSLFQSFLSLPYFSSSVKPVENKTNSESVDIASDMNELVGEPLSKYKPFSPIINTSTRPLTSTNPLFQPLTPRVKPNIEPSPTSGTGGVFQGIIQSIHDKHGQILQQKDSIINNKSLELVNANEKLAQTNEKLSFVGKYLSANAIDTVYSLQYTGFTTYLYILSVSLGILLDSLIGLSANTATLLTVTAITNLGLKKILFKVAHPVINLVVKGSLTIISDVFNIAHKYIIVPVSSSSGILIIVVFIIALAGAVVTDSYTALQSAVVNLGETLVRTVMMQSGEPITTDVNVPLSTINSLAPAVLGYMSTTIWKACKRSLGFIKNVASNAFVKYVLDNKLLVAKAILSDLNHLLHLPGIAIQHLVLKMIDKYDLMKSSIISKMITLSYPSLYLSRTLISMDIWIYFLSLLVLLKYPPFIQE